MAADSDIRWGILGTAHIATKVCNAIHRAREAQPLAIASRQLSKAQQWATQHQVPKAYGSYEELLRDPEIDAIYLPLPPSLHKEWVLAAADHGKHVLCEKPLAGSTSDCIAMLDACRSNQVQLMDGVMWVHHERATKMKQDFACLGRIRRLTAAFTFCWDDIPENNIRLNPELAGGCLGDLGYYCVRAAWWAFGEPPKQVYATARYYNDVEMNLSAMMWYDDERMASFDCGFDTQLRNWLEVSGSQGSLVCDDFVLPVSEERARWWLHLKGNVREEQAVENCVQEVRMIENFSDLVRHGELEPRWPNDAVSTMRICDALAYSARHHQKVEVAI